jgi:hypothetical protein
MNTRSNRMRRLAYLTLLTAFAAACGDAADPGSPPEVAPVGVRAAAAPPSTRDTNVIHVPFFISDSATAHHFPPFAPSTLLYEARAGNPILAPDGHQVTYGDFTAVTGRATAQCLTQGTHVVLKLQGLIPRGVYTIWSLTFRAPGFDPSFANLIGLGALGDADGSENSFRASESGEGALSALVNAGPLSVFGAIGACGLDEFEWHVVGAYHIDGQTHGATPGPDGTQVEQFAFIVKH